MGIFDFFRTNIEVMTKIKDINGLIIALSHKDWAIRKKAVSALGKICGNSASERSEDLKAVEALISVLSDYFLGEESAKALVNIGTIAVEPLIAILRSSNLDDHICFMVAGILGEIGDSSALKVLEAIRVNDNLNLSRGPAAIAMIKILQKCS